MGQRPRARKRRVGALAVLVPVALSSGAAAQVLQIGADGAVVRYDGPAVFSAAGASPIVHERSLLKRPKPASHCSPQVRSGILDAASVAELSPALIEAVARQESGLRPGVISRAGAVGEMQLMPATSRGLGVDPRVSAENYRGGATYLRRLMRRYDGDLVRALAAYNAGPAAVDRYHGPPPYRETQAYVAAVLERLGRVAADEGKAR